MRILKSERLILRPLTFNELLHINNNDISKFGTYIETEAMLNFVKTAISKKITKMQNVDEKVHPWCTYWLIIDSNNGKGVGFIGFKGFPDENGYSEVGYSISTNYRKKRLTTEALETLLKWADECDECRGITAKTLKTNTGSNKVLQNCNFQLSESSEKENYYVIKFK
ncbi:MAG: GNAT family N-acetyltransferase [Solirubrobacterales bacterium]